MLINVREVKVIIFIRVIEMIGVDVLFWKKGILEVCRKCKIKICVYIDFKNYLVWNSVIYWSCREGFVSCR